MKTIENIISEEVARYRAQALYHKTREGGPDFDILDRVATVRLNICKAESLCRFGKNSQEEQVRYDAMATELFAAVNKELFP